MAQAQQVAGTANSSGAQQGSAVYLYGAGQGAGEIPSDSAQLTLTHTDYRWSANFNTDTTKKGG